jgi:hypothetical protein
MGRSKARRQPAVVCEPVGSLVDPRLPRDQCTSGHPYVCECGAQLIHQWQRDGMDWYAVDELGRSYVDNSPEGFGTAEWWDNLAKTNIGAYSSLKVRMDLVGNPFIHHHRAVSCYGQEHPVRIDVPFCCASPMRLVRAGWCCRKTSAFFPFAARLEPATTSQE